MKTIFRILVTLAIGFTCARLHAAGNLKVTLTPPAAITAGAQWRVDGGAWQASGATVKSLFAGTHNLEFKAVTGWIAPGLMMANITNGNTTTLTGTYTQPASIKVNLTPTSAQWRVDGGAWRASGTTVSGLAPGSHSVDYAAFSGYATPVAETVTLVAAQTVTLTRSYAPAATLLVHASPSSASRVGAASWRVDGGTWEPTELPVTLAAGSHLLEFQPVSGWVVPTASTITLTAGQVNQMNAQYYLVHRLRFFLHPNLVGTLTPAELQNRIGQYAAHLQTIYQRESVRRFTFNPQTDITIATSSPFAGTYNGTLPEVGFEVWVYADLTDNPSYGTYGGNMSFDLSGAGGATGLHWDRIYDPSTLLADTPELAQYWTQIDHMTHELEHTFGAGFGEYYSPGFLTDPTTVEPILATTSFAQPDPTDHFWGRRPEYWTDPLTVDIYDHWRAGNPKSLPTLLATTHFAPATKGVLASLNRLSTVDGLPDLTRVKVSVVDATTGLLIPGATFRAWNRRVDGAYNIFEQTVTPTATPGVFEFSWSPYPQVSVFGNYDNMKILKAWAPGYAPKAQWEWIYDAQKAKTVDNKSIFEVTIALSPQ